MTAIPKQVLEQQRQAEAKAAQQAGVQAPPESTPAPGQSAPPGAPTSIPSQPQGQSGDHSSTNDWEAKFKSMQGRFDVQTAQLRDAQAQNNELRELNAGMKAQLDTFGQRLDALQQDRSAAAQQQQHDRDAELRGELTEYGEPFGKMFDRQQAGMSDLNDKVNRVMQALQSGQMGGQQAPQMNPQSLVRAGLISMIPNFQQVDNDPAFHEWLRQPSPGTGLTHFQLLGQATHSADVERAAEIYQSFLREKGAAQPAGQVPITPETTTAPAAAPQGKPMVPVSEYRQYADAVAKGHYKDRPEEQAKLSAYFDEVEREGRFIPG